MSIFSFTLDNRNCYVIEESRQDVNIFDEFPHIDSSDLSSAMSEVGYHSGSVSLGFNYLLLEWPNQVILIDTGRGTDPFLDSLKEAGYSSDDIDLVIITHGDGDHVGGLKHFHNAEIVMPRESYELWTSSEGLQTLMTEFEETMSKGLQPERLELALKGRLKFSQTVLPQLNQEKRLTLVDPGEEITDGVTFIEAKGHRSDHFVVDILSGEERLLHLSDALRSRVQLQEGHWHSIYDSYPEQFSETLASLLVPDHAKKSYCFATHLTFPGLLKREGNEFIPIKI